MSQNILRQLPHGVIAFEIVLFHQDSCHQVTAQHCAIVASLGCFSSNIALQNSTCLPSLHGDNCGN